MKSPVMKRKL